jgi:hypothetical protein
VVQAVLYTYAAVATGCVGAVARIGSCSSTTFNASKHAFDFFEQAVQQQVVA